MPLLDIHLLDELLARWRDQRAPIADRLEPGLPNAAMDELTSPLGLRLPAEARVWWGWRDGAPQDETRLLTSRQMGTFGLPFLSLEEAVAEYRSRRDAAQEAAARQGDNAPAELADPDYWWDLSWFPITVTGNGTAVACDCSVGPEAPTPIRAIRWGSGPDFGDVVLPSMRELVKWWIDAFDNGTFRFDAESNLWTGDPGASPRERWQYGIA